MFDLRNKRFSVLAAARSSFYLLNLPDAVYITTQRSVLYRQKVFVYTPKLDNYSVFIWLHAALLALRNGEISLAGILY